MSLAFGIKVQFDFCLSPFNSSGAVEFSRNEMTERPPLSVNVRVHVRGKVPFRAPPEALGVTRHQSLRDVSPRSPNGRVVIRPLDEELRSSVLHHSMPE